MGLAQGCPKCPGCGKVRKVVSGMLSKTMGPMGHDNGVQNVQDVHITKTHCASRVSRMSSLVDLLAFKNDLRLDKIRKDIIL
jgi:hypothetical protein